MKIDIEDVSNGNDVYYIATDSSDLDSRWAYQNGNKSLEALISDIKKEKAEELNDFMIDTLWIHKIHLIRRIDIPNKSAISCAGGE